MSTPTEKVVICHNCGKKTVIEIYRNIDVGKNPELKEKVMNSEINNFICADCGSEITGESRRFMYHDPKNNFAIYYVPIDKNEDFNALNMQNEFQYDKMRIVYEYGYILEKIRIFEQGLNDMVIELSKAAAIMHNSDSLPERAKLLFLTIIDNNMGFAYMDLDKPSDKYDVFAIPFDGYESILSDKTFNIASKSGKWLIVDSIYAFGQLYGQEFKGKLIANLEETHSNIKLAHLWP